MKRVVYWLVAAVILGATAAPALAQHGPSLPPIITVTRVGIGIR